jgi:hypothetical protein
MSPGRVARHFLRERRSPAAGRRILGFRAVAGLGRSKVVAVSIEQPHTQVSTPTARQVTRLLSMLRRLIVAIALSGLLVGCSGPSTPTASRRVVPNDVKSVCQAALTESQTTAESYLFLTSVIDHAKSWGGKAFAHDVDKWQATATDPYARLTASKVVVHDCERFGVIP